MSDAPVTSKHLLIGAEELDEIRRTLHAGELGGKGSLIEEYERGLAQTFGARHALAVSSGTGAIHLSLLALGVGPGDEVILPATAAVMTALPVLAVGARPVIVDTADPATFDVSIPDAATRVGPRTKAVITVPMWGYAHEPARLAEFCASHRLPLIEDAAQAHGSRVHGRTLGTFGSIGCFSTHLRKLIATGEGGFCLTDDERLHERLFVMRTLGQAPGGIDAEAFGRRFGLNLKLPGVAAAIGRAQLRRLAGRVEQRNATAQAWTQALAECAGVEWMRRPDTHNCYGLAVLVPERLRAAVEHAIGESGMVTDTRAYECQVLHDHPLFREFTHPTPHARALLARLIVLPCHEAIRTEQIRATSARVGRLL